MLVAVCSSIAISQSVCSPCVSAGIWESEANLRDPTNCLKFWLTAVAARICLGLLLLSPALLAGDIYYVMGKETDPLCPFF